MSTGKKIGFVAIVGRTNVGKSTLLNAILGEKVAIVSDRPQTTRARLLGILTEERGQVVFFDTPGLHKPQHLMNRQMVAAAEAALMEADLTLAMFEAPEVTGPGDRYFIEMLKGKKVPAIAVINKIDRCDKKRDDLFPLLSLLDGTGLFSAVIPISALQRENLDRLTGLIFAALPEGDPRYDTEQITDLNERQSAAEIVREKVLNATFEEIPHSTHTVTEIWEELEDGRLRIGVAIWVERDSQKGVIIGKGGAMLKKIGTEARADLNDTLDRRVHLELFVKVKKNWRDLPSALKELGL